MKTQDRKQTCSFKPARATEIATVDCRALTRNRAIEGQEEKL